MGKSRSQTTINNRHFVNKINGNLSEYPANISHLWPFVCRYFSSPRRQAIIPKGFAKLADQLDEPLMFKGFLPWLEEGGNKENSRDRR